MTTDPRTAKLRASHARVLQVFRAYGDLADVEMLAYLNDAERQLGIRETSPSGARTRRSELSRPNEERVVQLTEERLNAEHADDAPAGDPETIIRAAREQLRAEGFRSPLWAVGSKTINGRTVTTWGIAR